tara:strand:+ start:3807 stop:4094 length:288 start_codon:yes stop_codon:yes gene_type:complete
MKLFNGAGIDPNGSDLAKSTISALYEERAKREPSKKRAFGVSANSELLTMIGNKKEASEDKVQRITSLFFEHCKVERTDSLEHYLARQVARILED